jgi:hypothetical protein
MLGKFNPSKVHCKNSEAFRKLGPWCEYHSILYRLVILDRVAEVLRRVDIEFMGKTEDGPMDVSHRQLIVGRNPNGNLLIGPSIFDIIFDDHSDSKPLSTSR